MKEGEEARARMAHAVRGRLTPDDSGISPAMARAHTARARVGVCVSVCACVNECVSEVRGCLRAFARVSARVDRMLQY